MSAAAGRAARAAARAASTCPASFRVGMITLIVGMLVSPGRDAPPGRLYVSLGGCYAFPGGYPRRLITGRRKRRAFLSDSDSR